MARGKSFPFTCDGSAEDFAIKVQQHTKRGTGTDGFENRKFGGLSELAVHQHFWYPFGWFFGTQKDIKTDHGFQNRKFWGLSKLAILVHQQFWYPFG